MKMKHSSAALVAGLVAASLTGLAGTHTPDQRSQGRSAIHHRRIDHLPATAAVRLDDGRQYAKGQQHAAAALGTE